jgi:hypothetical protein
MGFSLQCIHRQCCQLAEILMCRQHILSHKTLSSICKISNVAYLCMVTTYWHHNKLSSKRIGYRNKVTIRYYVWCIRLNWDSCFSLVHCKKGLNQNYRLFVLHGIFFSPKMATLLNTVRSGSSVLKLRYAG